MSKRQQRSGNTPNPHAQDDVAIDRLVPIPEVQKTLGDVSRTTVWRLAKDDPSFPKPVAVGGRSMYSSRRLASWIDQQVQTSKEG